MTRSWNIVMTRILEHCGGGGGGAVLEPEGVILNNSARVQRALAGLRVLRVLLWGLYGKRECQWAGGGG